jgi:hypothetical protein
MKTTANTNDNTTAIDSNTDNIDDLNETATYPDIGNITAAELDRNIVQAVDNWGRASTAHEKAYWANLIGKWSQDKDMITRRNKERKANTK